MTLQDIYDQLSFGELRQLFLAGTNLDSDDVGMAPENYPKILPSVLLGITELHKRFFIREGQFYLVLQDAQASYSLTTDFALSNTRSQEPVKYIDDTLDPFKNNLFKVERVLGTYLEETYEIPMNERGDESAIFTTAYNKLIVPTDADKAPWLKETTQLDIRFRADHPEISVPVANAAPTAVDIELSPIYLESLLFYVASRLHNPLGMTPETVHDGNNYFQRFLASVEELKMQNFEIDDNDDNLKLWERGFC